MRALLGILCWCILSAAQAADDRYLDVGVVVFDPGLPAEATTDAAKGVFPEIRRAETGYMAVELRRALEASGDWGAVRVMPSPSDLVDLTVQARVLDSTGQHLALQVNAVDATGRVWIDQPYAASAGEADYPVPAGGDPFRRVYREIAGDLARHLASLGDRELRDIRQVARLRYARGLAPDAFADYLGGGNGQPWVLLRLPAQNDPMLARVDRIRQQEYIFIDNVDEQYQRLHDEMASTYALWRQYRREEAVYQAEYQARQAQRDKERPGTFAAMESDYNTYRAFRTRQQDLKELAGGFNNEVGPTVVEANGKVFRLSGTLDSRYEEWRKILREIFKLETGLPPAAQAGG